MKGLEQVCKTKPYQHQLKALQYGHNHKLYAYFMEMGTGKTKVAIDNANYLYDIEEINDVVVIAPNSVYRNWQNEIYTHSKKEPKIFVWKQHKVAKLEKYDFNDFFFLLMNVESLSRSNGIGYKFLKKHLMKRGKNTLLIVDESTTIKNKQAQRTKALCELGKLAKYRRILTGSPVTKSPLDLYTQCEFLSKDCLGFSSYYTFRNRYAIMKEIFVNGFNQKFPIKYINLEELEQKLKSFSFRCKKSECLDLPDKIPSQRTIEMTPEQIRVYTKLKREARAVIEDKEVSFTNKLTEIIKLHQVCCGFSKTDDGEVITFGQNPKLKELKRILAETDEKSIIWANYIHNIKEITQMLKETYGQEAVVSLYGEVSIEDRTDSVKRFQDDPRCRFLVGNPSVGGYGLTLTAAGNVIYFSNSYNLEHREQSEDRAHRIGQEKFVNYIDLVVPKTIDELILKSLQNKKALSEEILGDNIRQYLV